jgi:DNA polymerase-3 subunit delta'
MAYDKERFSQEQPILAKFFINAIEKKRLSNAYLLYGEPSAPLLESALFIAKSLECEKGPLACGLCPSCKRFAQNIHPDCKIFDGSQGLIKKSDIDTISEFYATTVLEKGHRSVYIINHIENITEEAINALLKTLEEPSGETVAILTTDNLDKVLPTILSRSEPLQVRSPDLVKEAVDYQGEQGQLIYFLVSHFAYDEDQKKAIIESKGKEFTSAYDLMMEYVDALIKKPTEATYLLMKDGPGKIKGNKCYNYFYSMLSLIFTQALQGNDTSPFKEITAGLSSYEAVLPQAIALLNKAEAESQANMNFTFMLARLARIMEGR